MEHTLDRNYLADRVSSSCIDQGHVVLQDTFETLEAMNVEELFHIFGIAKTAGDARFKIRERNWVYT